MIEAKIIEDSVSEAGVRLTTMQLTYQRLIHSEMMTHRVFSRNASSSRAIPVDKMIEQVRTYPAMPIHWGKNQKGMQAREEIQHVMAAKDLWVQAANKAADMAQQMNDIGLHKQVVNRLLEPFQWMHVIVSATEWDNFFELRDHEDAQPEIQHLARLMRVAMDESTPVALRMGAWHLPYVSQEERQMLPLDLLKKISTARCARVSYLTHDGLRPDVLKDIDLYERLVGSRPLHASPAEHQATPFEYEWKTSGNFRGWFQHRKELEERSWTA